MTGRPWPALLIALTLGCGAGQPSSEAGDASSSASAESSSTASTGTSTETSELESESETGEPPVEEWDLPTVELELLDCSAALAPANLSWVQRLGPQLEIRDMVVDQDEGAVLLAEDGLGALVLRIEPEGALSWAERFRSGDAGTRALDLDARADGEIALALEGARSWVWQLGPDGSPRWGHRLEHPRLAQFVSFSDDYLGVALSNRDDDASGWVLRLSPDDGSEQLIGEVEVSEWFGLIEDTQGGAWTTYMEGDTLRVIHLEPSWATGVVAKTSDVDTILAMDHNEVGELAALLITQMDLLRVFLWRFNGDIGGAQVITYDNGVPRALSLGPADDLILGFEQVVAAYDTDANLLWEGPLECPELIRIDEVELDLTRRTWVAGRHGDEAFVGLIEPGE